MKIELVGHLAGALVAIALLPQVIKAYRTRSTQDISILWTLILITGLVLWVTYAVANSIVPLALFGSIECLLAVSILTAKVLYG